MRVLAERPVLARIAEPCAWMAALWILTARLTAAHMAAVGTVLGALLACRLVVDTAPNLAAAARLEESPATESATRRALARVKVMLALCATLLLYLGTRLFPAAGSVRLLVGAVGAPNAVLLGFSAVLSSFAVATPLVREHRGVPIARPSLGPMAGALAFLALSGVVAPDPRAVILAAAAAVVAGNVLLGGIQRFLAASRRLQRGEYALSYGEFGSMGMDLRDEEQGLVRHALRAAALVLLPAWPALWAIALQRGDPMLAAALATWVAATPPILFDARRNGPRFRLAAFCAGVALVALAATTGTHVYLEGALLVWSYPAAARLVQRGRVGLLGAALVLLALTRLLAAVRGQGDWPAAEALFLLWVTLAGAVRPTS